MIAISAALTLWFAFIITANLKNNSYEKAKGIKRKTFTSRLKHYLRAQPESWRGKLALFMCKYMVEPWDFNHCGLNK